MDVIETNEIKIKVSKQIEEKVFNMANIIFIRYTFVAYLVVVVAACSSTEEFIVNSNPRNAEDLLPDSRDDLFGRRSRTFEIRVEIDRRDRLRKSLAIDIASRSSW